MLNTRPVPQVSKALSLLAPVGGLNDLDPISQMGDQYMVDCMNVFPDTSMIVVRPGYMEWNTGLSGPVKSLMYYNRMDGVSEIFSATDQHIYNSTFTGNAPPEVFDVTNGEFIFCNFATEAGMYLIACNGFQTLLYDGTTWSAFSEVTTPANPGEISGANPNEFDYVIPFKRRLWFIKKNSMTAYYLPLDSVGGVAQPFFFGSIFKRGGYLRILGTWSADTGDGLDDRLVIITSVGEVAAYNGTDPSSADTWTLDSTYFVAPPLSKRATADYGGDILLLSRRGLVPLSTLVSGQSTEVLYSGALSRRVSRSLLRMTQGNMPFPPEVVSNNDNAWILITLFDAALDGPISRIGVQTGNNKPVQLVMNFLTGAWGKFDYPIRTSRNIDKNFYMGTDDGRVLRLTPNNFQDNVKLDTTGGVPIDFYAMGAYTYLGNPTVNKHAKFVRPVFHTETAPSFRVRVLPDFRLDEMETVPPPNMSLGNARWDISSWDLANWAGLENVYRPWVSANVLGYAFSWQIKVSTSSNFGIAAVEWVWEDGGLI